MFVYSTQLDVTFQATENCTTIQVVAKCHEKKRNERGLSEDDLKKNYVKYTATYLLYRPNNNNFIMNKNVSHAEPHIESYELYKRQTACGRQTTITKTVSSICYLAIH